MKTISEFLAYTLIIAGFLGASSLVAQRGLVLERNYDPATVETLQGQVIAIDHPTANRRDAGMGLHLTLQTEKETITVHAGPLWFMKKQSLQLEAGDRITVTGSRVTLEARPVLIAAEIRKGDQVLKLRDPSGVPVWSGRGGRNR